MTSLAGRKIFITGANRGIGRAFLEEALVQGAARIYAGARNPESLNELVETTGGKVVAVKLDVTNLDDITNAAGLASDVDLLINNAGIAIFGGTIGEDRLTAARDEMEVNYFGSLNMARAFAPILKTNGGGGIINISSIAGLVNFPVIGSYSASKAAVHSLTQSLRAELAAQNTQVTGVYPGPVDTELAEEFEAEKTPPKAVVQAIYAAFADGKEDIFPDVMSEQMHGGLLADPKAVEKQAGSMLPA